MHVYYLEGSLPRMIIDKSVQIKQLNVVEAYGLLIFRADKGMYRRNSRNCNNTIELYICSIYCVKVIFRANSDKSIPKTMVKIEIDGKSQVKSLKLHTKVTIASKICMQ